MYGGLLRNDEQLMTMEMRFGNHFYSTKSSSTEADLEK